MSLKQKIITIMIMLLIVLMSVDIFEEKFKGILLEYNIGISKAEEGRVDNYNLINMDTEDRIRAFSFYEHLKPKTYVVGNNLNLEEGWYVFSNKGLEDVKLVVNGVEYDLYPDEKSELGNSSVSLYIKPGDKIKNTGTLEVNKTKIYD